MMEKLEYEKGKPMIFAAGRYAKREAETAVCPKCGKTLRLIYMPDVHDCVTSLSIICDSCEQYTVVSSAKKPDWMK